MHAQCKSKIERRHWLNKIDWRAYCYEKNPEVQDGKMAATTDSPLLISLMISYLVERNWTVRKIG